MVSVLCVCYSHPLVRQFLASHVIDDRLRIGIGGAPGRRGEIEHRIDNRRALGGRIMDHVAGGEGRLVEKRSDLGATGTGARLLDNVSRSIERRVMGSHESTDRKSTRLNSSH